MPPTWPGIGRWTGVCLDCADAEQLARFYGRLLGWVGKNGLTPRGGTWEVYWTDPGLEPDAAKWRTQLFVPVR